MRPGGVRARARCALPAQRVAAARLRLWRRGEPSWRRARHSGVRLWVEGDPMSRLLAWAAAVAVLLLAGCGTRGGHGPVPGHGASGQRTAAGRVAGRLLIEGGALGPGGRQPGARPVRGVVTFTTAGHRPVKAQAGRSGVFSVGLPPGRYPVSGRSPAVMTVSNGAVLSARGLLRGTEWEAPCSWPLSVTVTAHHTVRIAVICFVP